MEKRNRWTRRKFLKRTLAAGGAMAGLTHLGGAPAPPASRPAPRVLASPFLQLLRAAMDEIVPATDGMPAASEAGGVAYLSGLARQSPEIRNGLEKSLAALEGVSKKEFHRTFLSLSRPDRTRALGLLEKQAPPDSFNTLRDFVYEAYYTRPEVWKLMGYEFHPTNQSGPRMKPFDDAVLSEVRKRPKFYREV